MQKAISILMLFALSFECFSKLGIVAYYQLNRQYIAAVLCVNRDKPMMHCNGHCYLRKKLDEDRQRENRGTGTVETKAELVLFCSTEQAIRLFVNHSTQIHFPAYLLIDYTTPPGVIFHPPRIA